MSELRFYITGFTQEITVNAYQMLNTVLIAASLVKMNKILHYKLDSSNKNLHINKTV